MTRTRRATMLPIVLLAWMQTGYTFYNTNPDDPSKGLPLRWYVNEIPVNIDEALSREVPAEDTLVAIRESMAAWNDVDTWSQGHCTHPRLVEEGLVSGMPPIRKVGNGEVGCNLVVFESGDAWLEGKSEIDLQNVIALTTLFYDPRTGEARSYALEMNEGKYEFAVLALPGGDAIDLANTLTHEFGHVLALDHTQRTNRESTMYYSAPAGEVRKRSLETDDMEGLCALYSVQYAEVIPDEGDGGGGCASGTSGTTALPCGMAILAALGLLAGLRRRPGRDRAN